MAEMAYVCLYLSYLDCLAPLSNAIRGQLVFAMLQYAKTGTAPHLTGSAKVLWPMISGQIDRDKAKYAAQCESNRIKGRKGGRPRKITDAASESCGFFEKAEKAKERENDTETDIETDNETVIEKDKDITRDGSGQESCPALSSFPPTEADVLEYCRQQGIHIDAAQFVDYYTSNGWMVGQNKMRNWPAAVRSWSRKEALFGTSEFGYAEPDYGIVL